jgi:hypothetical protein
MGIIEFLSEAIEPGDDSSEAFDLSYAAAAILQHAATIMPWFWRASQHGIQSEFILIAVFSNKM